MSIVARAMAVMFVAFVKRDAFHDLQCRQRRLSDGKPKRCQWGFPSGYHAVTGAGSDRKP